MFGKVLVQTQVLNHPWARFAIAPAVIATLVATIMVGLHGK
jgi:hypothetical protein